VFLNAFESIRANASDSLVTVLFPQKALMSAIYSNWSVGGLLFYFSQGLEPVGD